VRTSRLFISRHFKIPRRSSSILLIPWKVMMLPFCNFHQSDLASFSGYISAQVRQWTMIMRLFLLIRRTTTADTSTVSCHGCFQASYFKSYYTTENPIDLEDIIGAYSILWAFAHPNLQTLILSLWPINTLWTSCLIIYNHQIVSFGAIQFDRSLNYWCMTHGGHMKMDCVICEHH